MTALTIAPKLSWETETESSQSQFQRLRTPGMTGSREVPKEIRNIWPRRRLVADLLIIIIFANRRESLDRIYWDSVRCDVSAFTRFQLAWREKNKNYFSRFHYFRVAPSRAMEHYLKCWQDKVAFCIFILGGPLDAFYELAVVQNHYLSKRLDLEQIDAEFFLFLGITSLTQ